MIRDVNLALLPRCFCCAIFFHLKIQFDPPFLSAHITLFAITRIVTKLSPFLGELLSQGVPLLWRPALTAPWGAALTTWHVRLPAAGGAAPRAHKCLAGGAHRSGAWRLLGKNRVPSSDSSDISTRQENHIYCLNYIHSESNESLTILRDCASHLFSSL